MHFDRSLSGRRGGFGGSFIKEKSAGEGTERTGEGNRGAERGDGGAFLGGRCQPNRERKYAGAILRQYRRNRGIAEYYAWIGRGSKARHGAETSEFGGFFERGECKDYGSFLFWDGGHTLSAGSVDMGRKRCCGRGGYRRTVE